VLDRSSKGTPPQEADTAAARARRGLGQSRRGGLSRLFVRRFWSRLSSTVARRIVLLNLGGLVALFLGFLWLNQTRDSVIDARVQSLYTQAEIIAAAVAASASLEADNNTITIDPDKLLELQAGESARPPDSARDVIEFSINPEQVAPALRRLVSPTRTRARLFDRDGALLLDTRNFYAPGDVMKSDLPPPASDEATLFERSWNAIRRRLGRMDVTPTYEDSANGRNYQEVARALIGGTGSVVRVNTSGQTIVSVAVPVKRFRTVQGVLMLMTQEGDIDRVIAEERMNLFLVFAIAASVMMILSFLMAGSIAEPLHKLAQAAERVRRGTKARAEIPDFTDRSDEIGHLSGALRDMTQALYRRIEAIESFAADVAHELKNPLTSLRSAVETLPLAKNEAARARLMGVIQHDVRRLDRLITDISSASRLDAEMARSEAAPVDMARLAEAVMAMANDVRGQDVRVSLSVAPAPTGIADPFTVAGHDSRLVQVLNNLVDNARSFSPEGGSVRIACRRDEEDVILTVDDDGPGIPDHALTRIFERFYTDRPNQGFGQNSGLGLSISQQIVEAHHGSITAENRKDAAGKVLGARFTVVLPAIAA
jgi:two-component system sensor histidine kinase ChvG